MLVMLSLKSKLNLQCIALAPTLHPHDVMVITMKGCFRTLYEKVLFLEFLVLRSYGPFLEI